MGTGLVLGFFDGIHKAHKALINTALKYCDNVYLITLKESPAKYFNSDTEYILSRKNSINKIISLGVKKVIELDFPSIVNMSADEYLKYLVTNYHPDYIFSGYNHTFGVNRTGNPEFLFRNEKKYNYKYICIPSIISDGEIVSSTLIKKYLSEGNPEKANSLLGENFILEGEVIQGNKIGRTLGFPTANIIYPKDIVKIPYGVYAVNILTDREPKYHKGIMNWGIKPTVSGSLSPVVEVHILNFSENLYGNHIKIEVIKYLREEKKFNNLDELKLQIKKDINLCLEL